MQCRQCGTENPEGGKFCGECGAPLERACAACGGANPPNFKFCGHCGAKLDSAAPTSSAPAPAVQPPEPTVARLNALLTPAVPPVLDDRVRPLPEQSSAEHRKLAILFADLKGSTALGERLATEEVHEVISPYLQEL